MTCHLQECSIFRLHRKASGNLFISAASLVVKTMKTSLEIMNYGNEETLLHRQEELRQLCSKFTPPRVQKSTTAIMKRKTFGTTTEKTRK